MDFFAYQQQARRYSALLLVLFTLAVFGLVLAVNLLVGWTVLLGDLRHGYRHLAELPFAIYGWTTGITLALIGAGTLRRLWELGAGGPVCRGIGSSDVCGWANRRVGQCVVPGAGVFDLQIEPGVAAAEVG